MITEFPVTILFLAKTTLPGPQALTAVPVGTPKSIPA
jgi:hypothetical protein